MKRAGTAVALACAAGLLLAGCGGGSSTGAAGPATSASPSLSPSASPTPSGTSTRPPAPAGTRWVTAAKAGVEFVVPSAWKDYDLAALLASADPTQLDQVTSAMNVTKDQMATIARTVELFVMDPATGSFRGNVQVLGSPMTELPTEASVTSQFAAVGMHVTGTTRPDTPAGSALVVAYTGSASGGTPFVGRSILVAAGGTVVDITVTAGTDARLHAVVDPLLQTLRPTAG